ncbi:hypothetical protein ARMGADRAFT_1072620 [Armillaria gallica]|uniref:Uncharacterized protein n=1 Tax=Armillaria gallica TaxID=47427 RepID=A0A2H3EMJ7_ARMGA|nr:hypothetical protein ARMGADRAFT_1072620 [Armillaria gallica]
MYKDWILVRRLPEEADKINQRIVENIQQVTEENQEYIRSYHPAVKEAGFVFVYFNPSSLSKSVWIVHPASARKNTFLLDKLSVAGLGEVFRIHIAAPSNGKHTQSALELQPLLGHYEI